MKTNWASILGLSSCLLAAFAPAQQDDLYLELKTPGIVKLNFSFLPLPDRPLWNQTLREDLLASGAFTLIETGVPTGGDPMKSFEALKGAGVDFYLSTAVEPSGAALVLRHNLYEVKSKKVILSKSYRGDPGALPTMAHTLADELVLYLTGQKGLSLTKIAFVSDRSGAKEIWVMDADGGNPQPLTLHKSISFSPAWSPDGKTLYYSSYLYGQPSLMALQWLEGRVRRLVPPGLKAATAPAASPDGGALVFAGTGPDGNIDLYRLDLASGAAERLTFSRGIDTDPAFAPAGNALVFTSDRSGAPQVFLADPRGLDARRITEEGGYNAEPRLSPDGRLLAYCSKEGNKFQIYLQDLLGGGRVRLTSAGGNESPGFSPDGRRILFASDRSGRFQIYTMNLDGGEVKQLTTEGNNTQPAWSPWLK
jgi:TolB protein